MPEPEGELAKRLEKPFSIREGGRDGEGRVVYRCTVSLGKGQEIHACYPWTPASTRARTVTPRN